MLKYFLVLIIIVFALIVVSPVYAQVQSQEVFRGREGDYEIIVNVQPVNPVVGTVHFSILPINTRTSEPIQDARITLFATDESGEELFKAPALNSPRFRSFYESNIKFKSEGTWDLSVEIDSGQLGEAKVSFPLEVGTQAFTPTNTGATVFFLFLVAVLFGGVFYVWYGIRRQQRARAA